MKNLSLTTLLIIITLGFSSCSQDDSIALQEPTAEELLKSFNLNKNTSGNFSLDYQLGNGVSSDNNLDEKTNINTIYLYSSEGVQERSLNQGLALQDGQLQVNFKDTELNRRHTIIVMDDDIKTSRTSNDYLESYGITGNGDGTYEFSFRVIDGISPQMIYNDDTKFYEIHLNSDSSASQKDFVETFTKEDGVALNIQFFETISNVERSSEPRPTQPTVTVEEGDGDD